MEENYWITRRRYSRRGILRCLGVAAGAVSLAPVIAACGSNSSTNSKSNATTSAAANGTTGVATSSASNTGTAASGSSTLARTASAPGISADTITVGTPFGLSGPGSSYAPVIQTVKAYFDKVNDQGGINGRKVKFLIEDDAYTAANTPPLAKKLVEQDHVFAIMGELGTPTNSTVVDYYNENKVPHLFLYTGASKWGDVKKYPGTIGFLPAYTVEGRIYGKYIAQNWPGKKVGILYQNDDFGKDYLTVKETLAKDNPVVDEETYETTAADVSQQVTNLKAKGAEVFVLVAIPKYAALALKAAADQGWKPNVVMTSVAVDQSLFALAGGPQNVEGVISDDFSVPAESGDPSIQPVKDLLDKYAPNTQLARFPVNGYIMGQMMVDVLKRAGVNPTRQSLLDAAESFKDYSVPQLVPGIKLNSSKTDHYLIKSVKLLKAQGGKFVYFGDVLSG